MIYLIESTSTAYTKEKKKSSPPPLLQVLPPYPPLPSIPSSYELLAKLSVRPFPPTSLSLHLLKSTFSRLLYSVFSSSHTIQTAFSLLFLP